MSKTNAKTTSYVDAARAILAGQPVPADHRWTKWISHRPDIVAAIKEMQATEAPPLTVGLLADIFPDEHCDDPKEKESHDRYNALTPVERAILEWACSSFDRDDLENEKNPVYLHAMRMAQRHVLERLVDMADEEAAPITPATFGDWHDDDGFEPDYHEPEVIDAALAVLAKCVERVASIEAAEAEIAALHADIAKLKAEKAELEEVTRADHR